MNDLIVPISIVQLDLNELDLGMIIHDLLQKFRCAVERKTKVLYLSFSLFLNTPVKAVILYICIVIVSVLD